MADMANHPALLACQRKVRHRTESKALASAARCAGKRNAKGLRVYHCPYCRGWHLTHQVRQPPERSPAHG